MSLLPAPELLGAFHEHERDLRVRNSKVAHALIVALVPFGSVLDWSVYPSLAPELLEVRVVVAVLATLGLGLHFTSWSRRNIGWLAMIAPLTVNAAICWMVFRSEGAMSPYYAGLNLVLAGIGMLLPWSLAEVSLTCLFTIGFYVAACLLQTRSPIETRLVSNNAYFLALTSIICTTAAFFKTKARFEDFKLRAELARSYQQVSELERLKTDFFANISHELRTPLTLIVSPLQDLDNRREDLPFALRELVQLARDNALRLLKLINDLLELGRLESDEFKLSAEPVELAQFASRQVESVRPLARLKQLELTFEANPQPLFVIADPAALEKVIINLLTNAIKFTPQQGRIAVRVFEEGALVGLDVTDTGIGIAASDLPYVFDRFRQAGASTSQHRAGVGIGLALARELAEKHGGALSAQSEVGTGSVFSLRLPRPHAGVEALPTPDPRIHRQRDSLSQIFEDAERFVPTETGTRPIPQMVRVAGRMRILIVDDEPDMRAYLASTLSDQYDVLEAADGEEGLSVAHQLHPELILVDLMLPGMDGWEVCRRLKHELPSDPPKVVVLTARIDEMAKIAALKNGADDFISKPFSMLEVRTRLTNLRHTHELERELRSQNEQLKETLLKLKAAETRLVQREKVKAVVRMAGGILHEINNPLNFSLTAINIAHERYSRQNPKLGEIIEDVRAGMVRIRDIVADLRNFASPVVSDAREDFDLRGLVEQAMRFTSVDLADISVECQVTEGCPAFGSKSQVLQVLTNLLLNAGSAARSVSTKRPPQIIVRADATLHSTRVRVWDNGKGISAAMIDKVFDPFLTTQEVGQGMGLGLSICQALIAAHGGEIHIESEEGSWTEVVFQLPARERESAA